MSCGADGLSTADAVSALSPQLQHIISSARPSRSVLLADCSRPAPTRAAGTVINSFLDLHLMSLFCQEEGEDHVKQRQ